MRRIVYALQKLKYFFGVLEAFLERFTCHYGPLSSSECWDFRLCYVPRANPQPPALETLRLVEASQQPPRTTVAAITVAQLSSISTSFHASESRDSFTLSKTLQTFTRRLTRSVLVTLSLTGSSSPSARLCTDAAVFNFPALPDGFRPNLAYNLAAGGVGADYRLSPSIYVRADWEYQVWFGFQNSSLSPSILTIGGAYRFR